MAKPKPIRLGIAGLGRAGGGMHCQELKGREDKFRIVAACDAIAERRDRMAAAYGCRTYAAVEDLLADRDVEMVSIATRSRDHLRHATAALKAGKIVFLEKPMCLTWAGARKLRAVARRTKGRLFLRHNRRFEPAFQHICEIIDSGLLGEVHEVKLRRHSFQRRNDWQAIRRFGGGQLLNWGPHIVDHALRLLGSPVRRIWSDLKRVAAAGDAEDHVHIILTGVNGRTVDLEISGAAAIAEPLYVVHGDRGALTSDGEEIRLRYLDPARRLRPCRADPATPPDGAGFGNPETLHWIDKTLPVAPRDKVSLEGIWDELFDAVRKGRKFRVTLDEALEVMRVIDAARKGTKFKMRTKN